MSTLSCKRRGADGVENRLDVPHILVSRVVDQRLPRLLVRHLVRQLPVVSESNVHRVQRDAVCEVSKRDTGAARRWARMEALHVLDGNFTSLGVEGYDGATVTVRYDLHEVEKAFSGTGLGGQVVLPGVRLRDIV